MSESEAFFGSVPDDSWQIVIRGFQPLQERAAESLMALSNGYIGSRTSLAEGNPASNPGTFIAGVFDTVEQAEAVPVLIQAPDCFALNLTVAGESMVLDLGDVLDHERRLDLRRGLATREWRHCDRAGRITTLRFLHCVSLVDPHVLLQRLEIIPENYTGELRLETLIDARKTIAWMQQAVANPDTDQGAAGAVDVRIESDSGAATLVFRTPNSGILIAFASATITPPGVQSQPFAAERARAAGQAWSWSAEYGRPYRFDRLVTVHTSEDCPSPQTAAVRHLQRPELGPDSVLAAHEAAWSEHWRTAALELDGDLPIARALHLAEYHLISSANRWNEHVSIGARGLTGPAYGGHVFWDTEMFMLPYFVLTDPAVARGLLMYRWHTLPAAREKARLSGYEGALYAWESAANGVEATPSELTLPGGEVVPVLCGLMEHHISADVAYAVWQYWRAAGDDAFFADAGAEIVLETARFWASRAIAGVGGSYHIRTVIGPDEYHEVVDDNAYTNLMARWNLNHGVKAVDALRTLWPERWSEMRERIGLTQGEVDRWQTIARGLAVHLDDESGVIEQFEGYHTLEEIDLASYGPRTVPIDMILGHARTAQSKVLKQADALMALNLLWDDFPEKVHQANFSYYEPRTAHGSSLSPGVHAQFAARLGDLGRAERYLRQTAAIDLDDQMANAAGGVHMAALGSLWQAVVCGFAGLRLHDHGLKLCPRLAPRWRRLRIPFRWRRRQLRLTVTSSPPSTELILEEGPPLLVTLDGAAHTLAATESIRGDALEQTWELAEESAS
jgi:kojibiose phosphorylase